MSHRKVYSQGNIPFSWEDSPGISKSIHEDYPLDKGLHALNLSSSTPESPTPFPKASKDIKIGNIPLPPCQTFQPARRSISSKGLGFGWFEDDPFLAAYKECTKNERNNNDKLVGSEKKKNDGKIRKKKKVISFSCKNSCDVKDDNLVKICNQLPSIPRNRVKGR